MGYLVLIAAPIGNETPLVLLVGIPPPSQDGPTVDRSGARIAASQVLLVVGRDYALNQVAHIPPPLVFWRLVTPV